MIKISKLTLGMIIAFLVFVTLVTVPASAERDIEQETLPTPTQFLSFPLEVEELQDINNLPLQDNMNIYQDDDPGSVIAIYITVRKGNPLENTDYTWAEVNEFNKWILGTRSANIIVGNAEVIVQFGDENGPIPGEFGYGAVVPNGKIQIRGASTSSSNQKSYKIEINRDSGSWRGQYTFALNKHIYDISRIRNKLSFDLLKGIPNMTSLRTQFVRLYVKDETVEPISSNFVDYGLFTQVEQVNRTFLRNHGLDPNAHLYKGTSFAFYRYEDQIRMEDDPLYNEAEFSHRLEIKGNRDHSKIISMLDDINDYSIPIEQSFEEHFNSDNYFTWMAYNILIGNIDTQNQNFFLYSPQNSTTWYFLPWDYDDSLFRQRRTDAGEYPYLNWEVGFANYWGVVLHNRVLRLEKYRLLLDDKMDELMLYLTPERIEGLLNIYRPAVEPYIFRVPDVLNLPGNRAEYEMSYNLIPSEIQNNYEIYLDTLDRPMPFYLGIPTRIGDVLFFNWDESYNFEPQNITYHFEVSRDFRFSNVVYEVDIDNLNQVETVVFEPGGYFWRVIATNEDGRNMYPFDSVENSDGPNYDGMKYFIITEDGQVVEEAE